MSDIVERLFNSSCGVCAEAFYEVERLRAEKVELLKKRDTEETQRMINYWGQRAEKAETETDRLRNEKYVYAREEIERLEADKAAISDTAAHYLHEIERLQEALRWIAEHSNDPVSATYIIGKP